jgi:hypothetical protein
VQFAVLDQPAPEDDGAFEYWDEDADAILIYARGEEDGWSHGTDTGYHTTYILRIRTANTMGSALHRGLAADEWYVNGGCHVQEVDG